MVKQRKKVRQPNKKTAPKGKRERTQLATSRGARLAATPMRPSLATGGSNWSPPSWYLLALVLVLASPAILGVYGHNYGYSPDLHMASVVQVGALMMLGLFFFSQRNTETLVIRPFPVMLPALIFVLWATLSLTWAHNRYEGGVKVLDWTGAVLSGLLVAQTLGKKSHIRWVLYGIFGAGFILLLLGIAQYFFDVQWVDQHAKPSITFNNKNMAAQYMLLIVPIGLSLALFARHWGLKLLFAFGGAGSCGFILLTNTRGAIIAMLAQLLLLMFLLVRLEIVEHKRPIRYVVAGSLLLVLVTALMLSLGPLGLVGTIESLYDRLSLLARNFSTLSGETRFPIWLNSLAMIRDHLWFGVGAGNWMVEYPFYHYLVTPDIEMSTQVQHINAHQDYLELAAELGLLGILMILLIGVQAMRYGWRLLSMPDRDHYIVAGLLSALAGLAVNAIGSFPFEQPAPVCLFMVYLGLLDCYYYFEYRPKAWMHVSGRRRMPMATVVVSVLVVALVVLHYRWYQSEIHFRRATIASRNNNSDAMLEHGLEALKWTPHRQRMGNFVGSGYMRRGETFKAVEAFEKVLDYYPHMMHTIRNSYFAYTRVGDQEKALEKLQQLRQIRPSPLVHLMVGYHLLQMGRDEDAYTYLRKSRELDRTAPVDRLNTEQQEMVQRFLARYGDVEEEEAAPAIQGPSAAVENATREQTVDK